MISLRIGNQYWVLAILLGLPLTFIPVLSATAAGMREGAAWELAPYRIAVWLQVRDTSSGQSLVAPELVRRIEQQATLAAGPAWELEVRESPHRFADTAADWPATIDRQAMIASLHGYDKLLLLVAARQGPTIQVTARELDLMTGVWSAPANRWALSLEALPAAATEALWQAFCPLARIENAGATVELRVRGGSLVGRNPVLWKQRLLGLFRPLLVERSSGGSGDWGDAQAIPWTYLVPRQIEPPLLQCELATALTGDVIPDYHPRRLRVALGIVTHDQVGRLQVMASDRAAEAAAGCGVFDVSAPGSPGASLGRTGPDGTLVIEPSSSTPLRWLSVREGVVELIRLPWVGAAGDPQVVQLPTSQTRAAAARALAALRDAIVDASLDVPERRAKALKDCASRLARIEEEAKQSAPDLPEPIAAMIGEVRRLLAAANGQKPNAQSESPLERDAVQAK